MERKFLSKIERGFVEELRANTRDKGAYMKLSVLVLLDMDETYERIAAILGIGLGTISNCKAKYEKDGLEKYLDTHYVPYSGKLTDEQLAQLEQTVCEGLYTTTQAVQAYIEKQFEVSYSLSAVLAILKKLDFVYKKTMSVPGKADLVAQEAYLAEMEPFLAEIKPDEVIYFVDAVHPQHNTRSDYAWVKRGEEKAVPTNTGRDRVNINGAVNAHKPEEVIIVEAERINAQSTIGLYDKIQQQNPDKSTIYIFCDNARYYYSRREVVLNGHHGQWFVKNFEFVGAYAWLKNKKRVRLGCSHLTRTRHDRNPRVPGCNDKRFGWNRSRPSPDFANHISLAADFAAAE